MTERDIQADIRIALGEERDLVLWRNSAGVGTTVNGHTQRFGLTRGAADLIGIGPGGRFVALEIKTPVGRLSSEQTMFLDLVRSKGGFAAVVRSVEDARAALERCREGKYA